MKAMRRCGSRPPQRSIPDEPSSLRSLSEATNFRPPSTILLGISFLWRESTVSLCSETIRRHFHAVLLGGVG
jgi:hypothetical protein